MEVITRRHDIYSIDISKNVQYSIYLKKSRKSVINMSGTQGFYGFAINGTVKVMRCDWDAYPKFLGENLIKYVQLNSYANRWYAISKRVEKLDLKPEDFDYDAFSPMQVLADIENGSRTTMPSAFLFAQDSEKCDYGYIINLDSMTLDLYRGLQRKPQKYNIFGETATENGYYPCKCIKKMDFRTATFQDMISAFANEERQIKISYSFINA